MLSEWTSLRERTLSPRASRARWRQAGPPTSNGRAIVWYGCTGLCNAPADTAAGRYTACRYTVSVATPSFGASRRLRMPRTRSAISCYFQPRTFEIWHLRRVPFMWIALRVAICDSSKSSNEVQSPHWGVLSFGVKVFDSLHCKPDSSIFLLIFSRLINRARYLIDSQHA